MKKVTLRNSFHRTNCTVLVPNEHIQDAWGYIQIQAYRADATDAAKRIYRRVRRELCGIEDCKCGIVR